MKRLLLAVAIVSLLSVSAPAQQPDLETQLAAQRSLVSNLSPTSGRVVFDTKAFPDGRDPDIFIGTDPQSGEQVIDAEGSLAIESDRLNLSMQDLLFNTQTGALSAKTLVEMTSDGITAWSDELTFGTKDESMSLLYGQEAYTNNAPRTLRPGVLFDSPGKVVTFDKMELFQVKPDGVGKMIIAEGAKEVLITMKDKPDATAAVKTNQLGAEINITVTSREGQKAFSQANTSEAGEMRSLRLLGSVRLLSERFNIRADEMYFDAAANRFEAIGNVYILEDSFQADCGQMVYDLETGRIRLSSKPFVSYKSGIDQIELTDYELITITPTTGKVPDVNPEGKNGRAIIQDRSKSATP
jgi:hypothetical protein